MGLLKMVCQHYGLLLSFALGLLVNFCYQQLSLDCTIVDFVPEPTAISPNEGLQAKLNLAGKPQKPKKVPISLVRPRYYSTELGIREKLFMGVLTTEFSVRNLAVAVNKSSFHYVDKLMFFMDAAGAEKARVVNLKLPGIVGFVDSREILKPFHTLKYLTDNFLEEYDFFFLTKDTTYVNPHLLREVVKSISVSQDVHSGFLHSHDSSLYCSLDSGILLSNSIVKKLKTSLDWCVKNAFSDSDDDNLGRCVLHASQLPCKNMTLRGVPLETFQINGSKEYNLSAQKKSTVFSYYSLKEDKTVYRLHMSQSKTMLQSVSHELDYLEADIDTHELSWPPGSYPSKIAATRFDVIPWQYFNLDNIFMPTEHLVVQPLSGADKEDTLDIIGRTVKWANRQYPELVYQNLVNGYRKFDPSRGMDYFLELSFLDQSGANVRKSFQVCKELGPVEMLPMPYVTETGRVHILLPIFSTDYEAVDKFMTHYSNLCSQVDLTFLILILLYEPNAPGKGHSRDVFKNVKDRAVELSAKKVRDCKITWISIRIPRVDDKEAPMEDHLIYFAMLDLVSKKLSSDSLILFTEPSVEIKPDFLNRVRMGTITNKQIYSPIPFSEYDPKIVFWNSTVPAGFLEIHKNSGRFDSNNIRHISFYLEDYTSARLNVTYLPVIKGDKDIIKMFSSYDSYVGSDKITSLLDMFSRLDFNILRSVEPSLRLRRAVCSMSVLSTKVSSYSRCDAPMGTRGQLGQVVLDMEGNHGTS